MKQVFYKIEENICIAKDIYKMTLIGDGTLISEGQFINIKIDGYYLRRPISVCDYDKNNVTIIYKVVGDGTEEMSKMQAGDVVDALTGLGNGFDTSLSGDTPLLIGGGVGTPPLYALCKKLISSGRDVTVVLGFNTKSEVFYEDEFKKLGAHVYIATVDGSYGMKGFVTDVMKNENLKYSYFYTCGPMPMFRAIERVVTTSGQYSFEERMGCGFGACMGCTCKTLLGNKRVCKDGPVFVREEIIW